MAKSHSARSRRKFATLKKPTAALAVAALALVIVSALGARPAAAQDKPAAAPEAAPAPVTSGYDKGFFIKADRFEIHFGTRLQLLYQYTDPDTFMYDSLLQDTEDTKPLNELFVRRFKFYMTGFAWNPALKYKVQFDVVPFKVGGGSGGGNVRLEEAFVDVTYKPWTQVRLGQFKVPFSYEKMTSSGKLDLVDRSIVHSFFGIEQEPGVNLYGQSFEQEVPLRRRRDDRRRRPEGIQYRERHRGRREERFPLHGPRDLGAARSLHVGAGRGEQPRRAAAHPAARLPVQPQHRPAGQRPLPSERRRSFPSAPPSSAPRPRPSIPPPRRASPGGRASARAASRTTATRSRAWRPSSTRGSTSRARGSSAR